ncbi:MAG: hypothetical protein ACYCXA_13290 [Actinomycetes bacterium]
MAGRPTSHRPGRRHPALSWAGKIASRVLARSAGLALGLLVIQTVTARVLADHWTISITVAYLVLEPVAVGVWAARDVRRDGLGVTVIQWALAGLMVGVVVPVAAAALAVGSGWLGRGGIRGAAGFLVPVDAVRFGVAAFVGGALALTLSGRTGGRHRRLASTGRRA